MSDFIIKTNTEISSISFGANLDSDQEAKDNVKRFQDLNTDRIKFLNKTFLAGALLYYFSGDQFYPEYDDLSDASEDDDLVKFISDPLFIPDEEEENDEDLRNAQKLEKTFEKIVDHLKKTNRSKIRNLVNKDKSYDPDFNIRLTLIRYIDLVKSTFIGK